MITSTIRRASVDETQLLLLVVNHSTGGSSWPQTPMS